MLKISIINLGIGNINSVAIAFKELNTNVKIIDNSLELEKCDAIILPGVGNFKHTMKYLEKENYIETLNKLVIKEKVPFLGICLGMQLLAEKGEEGGIINGLGFIPGKVIKLNSKNPEYRIPHMGWDDIEIIKKEPLFINFPENPSFYFVHSYYLDIKPSFVSSYCNYTGKIPASVQKDNIFGVQFHPEKSQKKGMQLLKNFCNYVRNTK